MSSRLGPSITIKGDLSSAEEILIEGGFEGRIAVPDHAVTIGTSAMVKGDVYAKLITVLGSIDGNLMGADRIEIRTSASVSGDVVTPRLSLADGAQMQGSIDTKRAEVAATVARHKTEREGSPASAPASPV